MVRAFGQPNFSVTIFLRSVPSIPILPMYGASPQSVQNMYLIIRGVTSFLYKKMEILDSVNVCSYNFAYSNSVKIILQSLQWLSDWTYFGVKIQQLSKSDSETTWWNMTARQVTRLTQRYNSNTTYPWAGCATMALGLDMSLSISVRCDVPFSSETNILSFLLSTQYIFLPIQSMAIPSAPGRSCQTYTKYRGNCVQGKEQY